MIPVTCSSGTSKSVQSWRAGYISECSLSKGISLCFIWKGIAPLDIARQRPQLKPHTTCDYTQTCAMVREWIRMSKVFKIYSFNVQLLVPPGSSFEHLQRSLWSTPLLCTSLVDPNCKYIIMHGIWNKCKMADWQHTKACKS